MFKNPLSPVKSGVTSTIFYSSRLAVATNKLVCLVCMNLSILITPQMIYVVAYQSDVRIGVISTEASLPLLKGSLKNSRM
jgi:hypothetical protein